MPRRARNRILALVAVLAAGTEARGAPGRELVYGGDRDFPPYEFLDAQGEPRGLNVDLIHAVGGWLGLPVRVRLMPWSEVLPALERGDIDVATMYRSTQRARRVAFAIPHELVYHEIIVRRGAPAVAALDDLAGKTLILQGGTLAEEALQERGLDVTLRRVASEPEALAALARGEGDAALVTQVAGRPFTERDAPRSAVVATGPPVLPSEYAFVTRPDAHSLLSRLDEGVAALRSSGDFATIYERWIRPDRSARLLRLAASGLVAAVVVALLIVAWNRTLRRRVAAQTRALRREYEEREAARQRLEESEQALQHARKMEVVGRLTGGVAHDFNNLLTVIMSYGAFRRDQLLAEGGPTEDVDEILDAAERGAALTRQLLAFSRSTPVQAVPLDVAVVVRETSAMVRRLVGEGIDVVVDAPAEPVVVEAEQTQLEQVLLNLAVNARDAMDEHGTVTIGVAARVLSPEAASPLPEGDYAVLSFADTGRGMDAATQARIFDPFFTTKEPGKGTGLGLATVFAIAGKLRGRVRVESAPGEGARFELILPRSPLPPAPVTRAHARPVRRRGRREPVLLVEDDDALRRAARRALEQGGYSVLEAKDGDEALLVAEATPPRAVVTDVVLPRRSGPKVVVALRERLGAALPAVYVSGHVAQSEALDLSGPATAFLLKPFAAAELVEAVHRLLVTPVAEGSGRAARG